MSEEKQQTIGEELSAARQARGLELEEIQRQSGVSLSVLQGIEAGELDIIEPVFVRLALKAYAEHLDLDPEPFLSRFDQQYGRIMQARSRPVVVLSQPTPRRSHKPLIVIGSVIGACCILAVAFFYFFDNKQTPTQETETPTQETETPTQAIETPTQAIETPTQAIETPTQTAHVSSQSQPTTTPSDPSVESSTELAEPLTTGAAAQTTEPVPVILELEARDSTWVKIRWDDAAENFEAIVPPGERHRFEARDHFVVLSTRPHGLSYWLDGQLLGNGQLGDPDQVLHFRAAADGIEFITLDSQPSAGEAPDIQP
ncbi:MAG: helix-turn-helix domain-containing protein [Candidatus Latescibacteria bacterium]|nr:helix-turn-helix domain-containing protein [Candidatus Latescibacterota bacterium]